MSTQSNKQKVTAYDVGVVYSDEELLELVTDLINGEYTLKHLREDFEEFITDIRNLKS